VTIVRAPLVMTLKGMLEEIKFGLTHSYLYMSLWKIHNRYYILKSMCGFIFSFHIFTSLYLKNAIIINNAW
jgi:hypothetical protein